MSKKEERLTKMNTSDLKPIQGGYNMTVTTGGVVVTGTLRDGSGFFTATFPDIASAYTYAEANLLKEGEAIFFQAAPQEEPQKQPKEQNEAWRNYII